MTAQKIKPTYKDLTKLMFTDGNPKTDKKHQEELIELIYCLKMKQNLQQ